MHLWPSMRLRDSFKEDYLNKLQFNFRRMNSHKQQNPSSSSRDTTTTKLLNDDENVSEENKADGLFCIFCKDLLMIFSLCFCCGACY